MGSVERILVVNPNASSAVSTAIDEALEPMRSVAGPIIEVIGTPDGPPGIETQQHVEEVVPLVLRTIRQRPDASSFVIACFSDPGLHAAREVAGRPVFGIAECGILTALTLGARFGLISILPQVIARHIRFVGAMGVGARFAGDRAIGRGVGTLGDEEATLSRMLEVGAQLRDQDGADVLVMACAAMAQYRARIGEALGVPVVEPTQAAVAMAIGRARLGW